MKQYYLVIVTAAILLAIKTDAIGQTGKTKNNTTSTTKSTITVNGKTYTQTTSNTSDGQPFSVTNSNGTAATAFAFSDMPEDTTRWLTREISKDFNIGNTTPVFIESAYRNLEIKTWDSPQIRIVATARYKEAKDADLSFDEVFEKAGIKIKNNDLAFEILGSQTNSTFSATYSYSDSTDDKPVTNGFIFTPRTGNNAISITTPDYFSAENGDTIMFHKDSASTNLRILLRSVDGQKVKQGVLLHNIEEKKATDRKEEQAKRAKIATLSKKMQEISKKIALLSEDESGKNNDEIAKLNKEISKLSNQIAFESIGNSINLKFDSAKNIWNVKPDFNWYTPSTPHAISFSGNVSNGLINMTYPKTGLKWTIYIPREHKLNIDAKYGNILVDNDLEQAKIISKYGNIETKNITDLVIYNEYGNIYTGMVQNGDVVLRYGKLKMQNVANLKIDSKNASIDLDEVGNIKIESSNDNYDISTITDLHANKNYGSFRLTTLKGKMSFNGINADIKIRNITPATTDIDITNKFAKISIPFTDVNNYNMTVKGSFNSPFDDLSKKIIDGQQVFNSSTGNGKDLNVNINCNSCTLDFK